MIDINLVSTTQFTLRMLLISIKWYYWSIENKILNMTNNEAQHHKERTVLVVECPATLTNVPNDTLLFLYDYRWENIIENWNYLKS